MFRILCDPSSGCTELCLTEITRSSVRSGQLGTSSQPAGPYTHTPQVQNICEPLGVISVKHSSVLSDDGSHKIRNMSE